MRGFTLVEIALIILITALLASISLKFTVFSGDVLYLKNFVYKLGSNINLLKDFALGRRFIDSAKVCGYGILFAPTNYLGYVFATSSFLDCDLIASTSPQSYAPSLPMYYLHTNGEIRQNPIEPLQIKDTFSGDFMISTSSNICIDDLFISYPQITLVYYNPYGDVLLLGENNGSFTNLLPASWDNIYFCFKYKNELRYLRINRSGQILIENP